MRARRNAASFLPPDDAANKKAAEELQHGRAWAYATTRQADADEELDQVAADGYTKFSDTVVAVPTQCQGLQCPERSDACDNCGLRLEKVLFQ